MSFQSFTIVPLLAAALLLASVSGAAAQTADPPATAGEPAAATPTAPPARTTPPIYGADSRFEFVAYGAYRWTFAIDASVEATVGKLDVSDSGIWGLALDINVPQPNLQIRLAYDRQDAQFQYRTSLTTTEEDGSVEYLQIGTVKGLRKGNVLPYGLFTLGATRFAADQGDDWKFSVVLGLGAKVYVNDRIGLMAQARMPYTFLSSGLGVGVGTGGVSAGITGWGVAQIDVGGGLVILL